ncbi:hypothetical protein F4804DRAFT_306751 [Jackrogersella minutella]|nr:hypothetical protein F4804DRAFT_306751 [Jackrogersella minutella]
MSLCRRPSCKLCRLSPEAATIHVDCFLLFRQRYNSTDILQRLWISAAWRTPWRDGPTSSIDDEHTTIPDISAVGSCLVPILRCLPPEIVQLIREYSAESLLWRFGLALGLSLRLSSLSTSGELVSTLLPNCLTWERDSLSAPAMCSVSQLRIIRLTIDSFGIKKIERLPEIPSYNPRRSDRSTFVTIGESQAQNVVAHFKFGTLRLEFPNMNPSFQSWDTETCPPHQDRLVLFRRNMSFSTQFQTINLRKITGITFFFSQGNIFHIHAHTAAASTAIRTWEHLSPQCQKLATWIYLPISPNDDIVALGRPLGALGYVLVGNLQYGFNLLFRLRLAGDVALGSYQGNKHFAITKVPIAALIHDRPQFMPISVIGAVLEDTVKPYGVVAFPSSWPKEPPFENAYYSSASLRNVIRILVFNNSYTGFCRGMLLEYENGAQRALGQCRIGIDLTKTYVRPTHFCFLRQVYSPPRKLYQIKAVIMECTERGDHRHNDEGWICSPMSCELDFWFDDKEVDIYTSTND